MSMIADFGRRPYERTRSAVRVDIATRVGLCLAVAILFGVSGGVLWYIGYNYDGVSGSPLTKIHPFSYLIFALALWRSMAFGNPIGYGALVASRKPAAAFLFVVASVLFAATAANGGPGLAGYADTYVAPALLTFLLVEINEDDVDRLTLVLHVAMTANALLGIWEFVSQTLWFPYRLDGEPFASDTRSSALQGHPLVNASLTAIYVLSLLGGARSVPSGLKLAMVALQCAALVVFGGRSAMVVTAVLGGVYLLRLAFGALRARRVSLPGAAVAMAILAVVPSAVFALIYAGYLDKIFMRFVSDGGSANARVEMFELLSHFSLRDLVVGPDVAYVDSLRRIYGLEWGIENPIVRMVLYQGGAVAFLILISVVLFFRELLRDRERGYGLAILAMAILLNTSESIAAKTTFVAKIVMVVVCLFRPAPQSLGTSRPSASSIAGSNSRVRSSMSPMPSNRFQNAQGKRRASALRRTSAT
jgi:hypothetical protein